MLRVRNLPPEPDWRDWLREEGQTIRGLGLWVVTLMCLVILMAERPDGGNWTLVTPVDGMMVATSAAGEAGCQALVSTPDQVCVPGEMPSIYP